MASAVSTEKFASRNAMEMYDHDPGGTSATLVSPDGGTTPSAVDLSLYEGLAVMASPSVGGEITKLEIVAADNAAMSTNLTVVKDSGTVAADALADYVFLECLAEEVRQLSEENGYNLRYACGRITMSTGTDEAKAVYVRFGARHAASGLTANNIT